MVPAESAYRHGLEIGQSLAYTKGDLFRDDFVCPANPYIRDPLFRSQFEHGLRTGLGEDFEEDDALWQTIESQFMITRKSWTATEIREEARARLEVQFFLSTAKSNNNDATAR